MPKFSRLIQLTFPILVLSFLNTGKTLAEIPTNLKVSHNTSVELLAQTTSTTEEVEIKIDPPLTQEQQTKIQAINAQYQPKLRAAAETYRQSLIDLDSIIGTNPTNEVIETKREKALDNQRELRDLAFDKLMEIRDVLTPQQKESISASIRQALNRE